MELGWAAAIQALIIALSTLIVRTGAKGDKAELKKTTASHDDVAAVRAELRELRADFEILRVAFFRVNPQAIDHRGPQSRGGKNG